MRSPIAFVGVGEGATALARVSSEGRGGGGVEIGPLRRWVEGCFLVVRTLFDPNPVFVLIHSEDLVFVHVLVLVVLAFSPALVGSVGKGRSMFEVVHGIIVALVVVCAVLVVSVD